MEIRIAIVDDLKEDRERLEKMVNVWAIHQKHTIRELKTYPRGEALLQEYQPGMFSLVFMDIVMDELNEKITIIALNRDTMTGIHKFTVDGKDRGVYTDHLSLSFAYGDGGKVSCENLSQAVSDLLYGIPISGYVVSNRASLPLLGDLIGPVEVVVPNGDLADQGFEEGSTVTIDSSNLMTFVRTRDIETDLSNVGRMQRQQTYINAAIGKILRLLTEDTNTAWDFMQKAEKFVVTNITRSRYLNLVKILKNTRYSADDYYTPDGEQVVGANYDEFYPDMEALHEKVIELFYMPR